MRRFFSYFLAFTVFLSVFSVLLPAPDARALSFPPVMETTTLSVISANGDYNVDVSNGGDLPWYDVIQNSNLPTQDKLFFQNARTGGSILVSQMVNQFGMGLQVIVCGSLTPNQNIRYGFYPNQDRSVLTFNMPGQQLSDLSCLTLYTSGTAEQIYVAHMYEWGTQPTQISMADSPNNNLRYLYYSTYTPQYWNMETNMQISNPGVPEPPTEPPALAVPASPSVGWTVFDTNVLNGHYTGRSDLCIPSNIEGGCVTPRLRWTVIGPGEEILNTAVTDLYQPYEFKLPGNDQYIFEIEYVHPGPPAALFNPDIRLVKARFTINANGTFLMGSTDLNECTTTGDVLECEERSPYEDCTVYGLDVVGGIGCQFRNFGVWLRNTLINLFVPNYSFYNNWVSEFGTYLNDKLGFVYSAFGLVIGTFTGVISNASTGKCTIAPPGQLFGATVNFDVCSTQTLIGNTAWTVLQGLVIGLTVLGLSFAALRKYQEVVTAR